MQPIQRTPIGAYQGRLSGVPLTGGQAQGQVTGQPITSTGSGALTLLQNANTGPYVVQANEFDSAAAFGITYGPGPPYGFVIANSSIANTYPGSPGAYPSIYAGNQYGNLSPFNPFPLLVSAIQPGQVICSVSATLPATGPIYDCSWDNWFNTAQNPSNNATNGTEWMVWLAAGGGNIPAGSLYASNASIGGYTFNVYYHPPWANATAGGTISFFSTSTLTGMSYDAYPFIQYMIAQGWLNPVWYLTNIQAGFEIWSGAMAGAAINAFTVSNVPALSTGAVTLSVGPQGLGTVWYPAQVTISTTTGPLDTSTCFIYLGVQGVPATLVATIFPGGAGTAALAIPPMMPGQVLMALWTGAHTGDTAGMNVIGTMDAITTGNSG